MVKFMNVHPMDIENKSFEIITKELGNKVLDKDKELIIKRVIHTTADFEYADTLCFSENAAESGIEALKAVRVLLQIHIWLKQESIKMLSKIWRESILLYVG